jgi:hypothetical protein
VDLLEHEVLVRALLGGFGGLRAFAHFARDLERLYLRMWERATSGAAPTHLPAMVTA